MTDGRGGAYLDATTLRELRAAAQRLDLMVYRLERLERIDADARKWRTALALAVLGAMVIPVVAGILALIRLGG